MKQCIRCGISQQVIRKTKLSCYTGWGSYKRHDYNEPLPLPKDRTLIKKV